MAQQLNVAAFFYLRNATQALNSLTLRDRTPNVPNIQLSILGVLSLHYCSVLLLFILTPSLHTLSPQGHGEISPTGASKAYKVTLLHLEAIPDFPWRFRELHGVTLRQCQISRSFFHLPPYPAMESLRLLHPI